MRLSALRRPTRQTAPRGFTLIELLIVVVIIGILASVAIPKYADTKQKAYVATMKSDLKVMVTVQEAFFSDSTHYGTVSQLSDPSGPYKYAVSTGTTVSGSSADASGWSAQITSAMAKQTCNVFGGTGPASTANRGAATQEGVPACVAGP